MTTHTDKRLNKCHWLFTANQSDFRVPRFELNTSCCFKSNWKANMFEWNIYMPRTVHY